LSHFAGKIRFFLDFLLATKIILWEKKIIFAKKKSREEKNIFGTVLISSTDEACPYLPPKPPEKEKHGRRKTEDRNVEIRTLEGHGGGGAQGRDYISPRGYLISHWSSFYNLHN